jgi:hypothetical protein
MSQNIYLVRSSGILGKTDDERTAESMGRTGWKRVSRYVWRKLAKEHGRGIAQDVRASGESANEVGE